MLLSLINASPKGKNGNTEILSDHFLSGFRTYTGNETKKYYAHEFNDAIVGSILDESDIVIIAFPLYCFNLPPEALRIMKTLADNSGNRKFKLGFICQYGFTEACHARHAEHLLERFCGDIGVENIGVIIRGGCEGLKYRPEFANKVLYSKFSSMGKFLSSNGKFTKIQLDDFSKPEHTSSSLKSRIFIHIFAAIGNRFFWKVQLKKNGTLKNHWDKPLLE